MPVQLPLDLPHRASLARDDLIVSASNGLAISAIDRGPDWSHPVLLIVGPPGSGKSHLAGAWCETAAAERLLPGHADRLLAQAPFRVAIDDVDRTCVPETELFSILNAARLGQGLVVATSRVAPGSIETLADLRSRLAAATIVELGRPDDALLSGVMMKLFADRQIEISQEHIAYLAMRIERSLEAAGRVVADVDREALASKGKITRNLLRRVLRQGSGEAGDGPEPGLDQAPERTGVDDGE